jgi:hypothetical protein
VGVEEVAGFAGLATKGSSYLEAMALGLALEFGRVDSLVSVTAVPESSDSGSSCLPMSAHSDPEATASHRSYQAETGIDLDSPDLGSQASVAPARSDLGLRSWAGSFPTSLGLKVIGDWP